ncbi:MAG TPA: polya polymerase [Clostridia bacterium]|nr:polya polymerase [Clostridia bacterium]
MRIKNITEPSRFFETVNACKGSVELLTGEGDRLNLKSTLCRYIALTQMFQEERVAEVELILSDERDMESLKEFLVTA